MDKHIECSEYDFFSIIPDEAEDAEAPLPLVDVDDEDDAGGGGGW